MSASNFSQQLGAFIRKVETNSQTVFVNVASAAKESIVNGSPLTGSPGQPVGPAPLGGTLKASWQLTFPSPTEAMISTNIPWASSNEDGIARPGGGAYELRSEVGGRHSVKLTMLNLDRIVADETAKVAGA